MATSPFGDYLKSWQRAFASSQPATKTSGSTYASLAPGTAGPYLTNNDATYRQALDYRNYSTNAAYRTVPGQATPVFDDSHVLSMSQRQDPFDLSAYRSGDPAQIAAAEVGRYNQQLDQNNVFAPRITDEQARFLAQLAPDLYRAYQSNPMMATGTAANNFTEWLNGQQGGIGNFIQHGDVGQTKGANGQNYYVPTSDRDPSNYFRNWVNTLNTDAGTRGQLQGMANDAWAGYVAAKNQDWYSYASFADYLKNLGPSGLITLGATTTPDQTFLAWVAAQHLTPGSQQVMESRYAPIYAQYLAAQQQNPAVGSFTDYLKTVNINNQLSQVPQAGAPGASQTYGQHLQYYGY